VLAHLPDGSFLSDLRGLVVPEAEGRGEPRQAAFAQVMAQVRAIASTGQIGAPVFSGSGVRILMAGKPIQRQAGGLSLSPWPPSRGDGP
jgi:hypothetical protein